MPHPPAKPAQPATLDAAPPQTPHINTQRKQHPHDPDAASKLPHERDQSLDMTDDTPDAVMEQAHQDLKKGLVDTDARDANGKPVGHRRPAR